ncbi:hypothetical protein [Metapseudomonas otitidis]|uniref:hypothetical protein n=1 Tax=Metapseudomonas otitidis TaxID=319939 RepID=UPI0013F5EAB3|nr:hypothetical protein [Pseudomonas otitidis]
MNKISSTLLILAIAAPQFAKAECAEAYWIPFDVELYAPENESSIEARAFERQAISVSAAESLSPQLFPSQEAPDYKPGNTRVLIRLPGKEIYIDRFGWIRQGNIYGKANAPEIEEKLSTPCVDK